MYYYVLYKYKKRYQFYSIYLFPPFSHLFEKGGKKVGKKAEKVEKVEKVERVENAVLNHVNAGIK